MQLRCPRCSKALVSVGYSDKMRRVWGTQRTDFMVCMRYKCKACPGESMSACSIVQGVLTRTCSMLHQGLLLLLQ